MEYRFRIPYFINRISLVSCLSSAANEIALHRTPEDLLLGLPGLLAPPPPKSQSAPPHSVQLQTRHFPGPATTPVSSPPTPSLSGSAAHREAERRPER